MGNTALGGHSIRSVGGVVEVCGVSVVCDKMYSDRV